jgi:hypothetical protein
MVTWLAAMAPPATSSELFLKKVLREVPLVGEGAVERGIVWLQS